MPPAARPAAPGMTSDPEINARLAATQADLANLRAEHTRLTASAQALSRDKTALEQRLATAEASRAELAAQSTPAVEAAAKIAQADAAQAKLAQELAAVQAALAETRTAATRT